MCLAIPGRIVEIKGNEALVDFEGFKKKVRIDFVKVKKNDYVIVHTGFAIEKVNKKNADFTIRNWRKISKS
ncbi:MAG: HypC/HybG/HupF family hydrogenase formation chaperone [Candidatus Marsarchaeota archaeon]|nr:HypC/HybG/HupF family hydrogenase formation chaperone [Candidatus Marsarchaeota archaeon]